jgi:hypothetical protein
VLTRSRPVKTLLIVVVTLTMKYACCKSTVDGAVNALVCIKCKLNYHVACLFPTDKKELCKKKISNELRESWLCPGCTASLPKTPRNDDTPVRANQGGSRSHVPGTDYVNTRRGGSSTGPTLISTQDGSLDSVDLTSIKGFISREISLMKSEFLKAITEAVIKELKPIREEISGLREAMTFINGQHKLISRRVDDLEKEIKCLSGVRADIGAMKESISDAGIETQKRKQWARRSNIEIFGIPERKGENLMKILEDISKRANSSLDPASDVDFVTRVAPKQGNNNKKIKPIVVRFLARWRKDEFLAAVKRLRLKCSDIGISGDFFIHFNDHLTSSNKGLLQRAKSICKERGYAYVWVKNCTIKVRRSDTSPVLHIFSDTDLSKVK